MANTHKDLTQAQKLNDQHNFTFWKFQICVIFKVNSLYDMVNGNDNNESYQC